MIPDAIQGKKIILGITGGIAAYKAGFIVRNLISRGAEVRVVMTPSALEFITPLTLSTLSQNDVIVKMFPAEQSYGVSLKTWHIDYALWADLILIAPATINTIAKIVNGFADNALTTVVAARRSPLVVAPAADMDMYNNQANISNIKKLKELGTYIVEAEEGFLASGLSGKGRMADVEKIIDSVEIILTGFTEDLTGKNILVTAGPTLEDIDPVRYIGNRSSGKMGYEISKAAFLRGANVTLISGPSTETTYPEIKLEKVRSAQEMKTAVEKKLPGNDILIMAAAVADYKPKNMSDEKIKKEKGLTKIDLDPTADILASLNKKEKIFVGFALETENELANAQSKLSAKNLDMIVVNSLKDEGAGFEHNSNKITILNSDGKKKEFPLLSKFQTANNILTEIKKSF